MTVVTMPPGIGRSKRHKLYYFVSKGYVGSISHTIQLIKVIVQLFLNTQQFGKDATENNTNLNPLFLHENFFHPLLV